ncbi:Nucleoporin [Spathaspora sp. JA1]|nr:Nucleoporin [Spathaspora sp. JA1]
MSIEEIISQDLGFKLDTPEHGLAIFDTPIDLNKFGEYDLHLLSINHNLRFLAISNVVELKLINLDDLEEVGLLGDALNVTQVHFNRDQLLVVNSGKIQTLSLGGYTFGDVVQFEDYSFDKEVASILPSPSSSSFLVLTTDYELYLCGETSKLVAANVSAYCWKLDGTYIYALKSDTTSLMGTPIEFDTPPEQSQIISIMAPFKNYILISYNDPNDPHDIRSYVLEDKSEYYVPMDAEFAPAFGMVDRKPTYYPSTIHNWLETHSYSFITSSLATELSILSLSGNHTLELIGFSEDIYRAQFPMNEETDDDCSPVGLAISYELNVQVLEPCPGVETSMGKLPKVYVLLDTGKLISYWVFHKHGLMNDEVSLERVIEFDQKVSGVQSEKVVSETPVEPTASEAVNPFDSSTATPVNPFGSSTANAFKQTSGAFGNVGGQAGSAFGSQTATGSAFANQAAAGSAFGNQTATGSAFGNQTIPNQTSSNTTSSNTTKSQPTTSAFGATGFGQQPTPAATSSAFGATGFGTTPAAAAANSAFTSHGFGAHTATPAKATSGGFATYSAANANSGFGQLSGGSSVNQGIFESSSDSPFGKLPESGDIFGQSKSAFGQLGQSNATSSAFGQIGQTKKPEVNEESESEEDSSEVDSEEESEVVEPETKPLSLSNAPVLAPDNTQAKQSSPDFFAKLTSNADQVKSLQSPFAKLNQKPVPETSEVSELSDEEEDEESTEEEITEEVESTDIEQSVDLISHLKLQSSSKIELPKPIPKQPSKLATDILSTSEEEETPEEEITPVDPVEFLSFDGLVRPPTKQNNVVADEISRLVGITQGNLSIMNTNVELLGRFIQDHESTSTSDLNNVQRISQRELLQPQVKELVDPLYVLKLDLSKQLTQVDELSRQVQTSLYEKVKLDKLYSRLAMLAHEDPTKTQLLKTRPLDIQNELMQMNLRSKLGKVKQLESQLYALIMPIKALNFWDNETLNNTESVIFQLNCQIKNCRDEIEKLEREFDGLEVDEVKSIELPSIGVSSPRFELRQRMKQRQPSTRLVKF